MKAHAKKFTQFRGVVFERVADPREPLDRRGHPVLLAGFAGKSKDGTPCYTCKGGLGEAPDPSALSYYSAAISLATPSFFADASSYTLGLNKEFDRLGWQAIVTLVGNTGYVYTNFKVRVSRKDKKPFSELQAKAAIVAAVASQSFNLLSYTPLISEFVKFGSEALPTAVSDKGRAQTRENLSWFSQKVRGIIGDAVCTSIETATGLPCTAVLIGAAVVGVGAVAVIYSPVIVPAVTSTKRALFGKS